MRPVSQERLQDFSSFKKDLVAAFLVLRAKKKHIDKRILHLIRPEDWELDT